MTIVSQEYNIKKNCYLVTGYYDLTILCTFFFSLSKAPGKYHAFFILHISSVSSLTICKTIVFCTSKSRSQQTIVCHNVNTLYMIVCHHVKMENVCTLKIMIDKLLPIPGDRDFSSKGKISISSYL